MFSLGYCTHNNKTLLKKSDLKKKTNIYSFQFVGDRGGGQPADGGCALQGLHQPVHPVQGRLRGRNEGLPRRPQIAEETRKVSGFDLH